jgi:8-oxo-dGTP diphosphatase
MKSIIEKLTTPQVGIGVMIIRLRPDQKYEVLLGKRKGSHGNGEYAWPGGHLEYMEGIEECAKREVMEETGMTIKNIRFLRLMNLTHYSPKHYVDIGLVADWESGEAQLLEPEKCEGWEWHRLDNLPEPLFMPVASYIPAWEEMLETLACAGQSGIETFISSQISKD